jgi:hypothetical protein
LALLYLLVGMLIPAPKTKVATRALFWTIIDSGGFQDAYW